jgi:hypothetical protein
VLQRIDQIDQVAKGEAVLAPEARFGTVGVSSRLAKASGALLAAWAKTSVSAGKT